MRRDGAPLWLLVGASLLAAALWWLLREAPAPEDALDPSDRQDVSAPPALPLAVPALPAAAPPAAVPGGGPPGAATRAAAVLRGIVLDEREIPLRDADVTLHAVDLGALRGIVVADGEPLAATRSADDGTFELPAPPEGLARVRARREGRASAVALADRASARITLVLLPEATLEVRLTSADGAPVGVAQVEVEVAGQRFTAQSASGLALVAGLPAGPARVLAHAEGRGAGVHAPLPLRSGEAHRVDVVLHPPARVAGRVLDAAGGVPIAEASVVAAAPGRSLASARTDGDGRFGPLDVGALGERFVVSVSARGYADQLLQVRAVAGGTPADIVVRLEAAVPWSGVLLEAGRDAPVAGAQVGYTPDGIAGRLPATATTDAEGRFTLPPPPPPAPGRRIVLVAQHGAAQAALALRPGQAPPQPLVLRLAHAAGVVGRIVAPDGTPRADVRVLASPAWDVLRGRDVDDRLHALNARQVGIAALTAADGSFRLDGLARGAWRLRLEHAGTVQPLAAALEMADSDVDLGPLAFGDGVRVTGLVVDHERHPVLGARVTVARAEPGARGEGRPTGHVAVTDVQGAFELVGLAPGDVTLVAEGSAGRAGQLLRLEAAGAQVILRCERAASLALSVREPRLPDGTLVEVEISAPGARAPAVQRAVALREGTALLGGLPAGTYALRVRHGQQVGMAERPAELEEGREERAKVELEAAGRLMLRVLDADRRPAPGVPVTWGSEGRRRGRAQAGAQATTDGEGRLDLPFLPAGRYELHAGHPGRVTSSASLVLRAGATETQELVLPRGGDVRVRVLDEQGRPVPDVRVRLAPQRTDDDAEEHAAAGLRTDARGEARFVDLPELADVRVDAQARDGRGAAGAVGVFPGAVSELVLRLTRPRR